MMDWTPLRDIPDPALVVMCGASGSGKSTLATFWDGQVVSSDALRALIGAGQESEDHRDTFDLVHRAVDMRLRRGLRTVVDATNVAREHRRPLLSYADSRGVPAAAVVCWPPLETCLERNAARERVVPEATVRRQYETLIAQMPSKAEGFERVIITGGESWLARRGGRELPPSCAPTTPWGRTTTPGWRPRRTAWALAGRCAPGHRDGLLRPGLLRTIDYMNAEGAP